MFFTLVVLYVGCIYIPPCNSQRQNDEYDECRMSIFDLFIYLGFVMLIGDLNSRTGHLVESLFSDSSILDYVDRDDMETKLQICDRVNQDISVNTYGRNLIKLLSSSHMFILNGRTLGDFQVTMFIMDHPVLI